MIIETKYHIGEEVFITKNNNIGQVCITGIIIRLFYCNYERCILENIKYEVSSNNKIIGEIDESFCYSSINELMDNK